MQKQAPQRAGGERAMSRKRGDAVGSRCHRREGRDGRRPDAVRVHACRASEFCVNSHFHLVLHDRYSDKTQCSSRENPDGRPRSWRDAAWSVHTCTVTDTDAQAHVSRHDSRDTRGLTRRADVPNECRIPVRPPRTVAPVGRYTVDRFGAVPAFLSHATECTVRCRLPSGSVTLTVTLIGTAVARPVA